ncbi:MAG: hypothetical protein ACLP8S_26370 [Solirubrobacteraceae bacterium]
MSAWIRLLSRTVAVLGSAITLAPAIASAKQPFINRFATISTLATTVPSQGPALGDQNPYGVAVVPRTIGDLVRGDVLVSNFNNAGNLQGTGSSIVEVSPAGKVRVFAVVPQPPAIPAVGLTTALVVLRSGYVIVGSLPAPGGSSSAAQAGALSILNSQGQVVETLAGGDINGPWDMTAVDHGTHVVLFVTNVLNGTVAANGTHVDEGTVVRIVLRIRHRDVPRVTSEQVIADGFPEKTDSAALVIGPTGVGVGSDGVVYVADTLGDRIAAIPNALRRMSVLGGGGLTVTSGDNLNGPLGLAIAPNGDLLTVDGGDGNVVETTPSGAQIAVQTLVANGEGDLFGLAVAPGGSGVYFVNDSGSGPAANSLQLLH